MPVFAYTARDQSGNQTSGTVEADTNSGAVAQLREQGLWVTDLRQSGRGAREQPRTAPGAPQVERSVAKQLYSPVSLKDLALFYRQLYTMLNSGMALYQSLELLSNPTQSPNASLRRVVQALAQQVLGGGRLSEAMARFPWLFDRMQVRMVEAGEAGGMLVAVLGRLADYLEREYEIRLDIKRKTLYPKILLVALIFIPQVPTLVLQGVVPYLLVIWSIVSTGLLVGIPTFFGFRLLLKTQAGREAWDQVKLLIPITGGLVRKLAVGRFARTLAALYGAGVPIASALAMAGEASGNSVLEKAAARMVPGVERGVPVAQAMGASGFFQPMVLGMVSTGETSGNLDVMLDKAADFYEEEGRHSIVQLVVILGVLLLLLMALIIAIKVISFYGGFYAGAAAGAAGGGAGE